MDYSDVRLIFPFEGNSSVEYKLEIINRTLAEPLHSLQNFRRWVESLLTEVQDSQFVANLEDPYDDFFDFQVVVSDLIGQNDLNELFENPSEPLEQLQRCLKNLLPCDLVGSVTDSFPLNAEELVHSLSPDLQRSFAAIASLVHESSINSQFLGWISNAIVPEDWHEKTSGEFSALKLCGIFERCRKLLRDHGKYWVVISPQNFLQMWGIDDSSRTVVVQFDVDHIDASATGNSLRIWKSPSDIGVRLLATERWVRETWLSREPLMPRCLPFYGPNAPPELIPAFRHALLQPDAYVLRAILDPEVTCGLTKQQLTEAVADLFSVFAEAGLVHRFVSTICATEFTRPNLSEDTLLQEDTQLIWLFRYYFQTFGRPFFDNVIRPMIMRIVNTGDLGIKERTTPEVQAVGELLVWAIDTVVKGRQYIPDAFVHVGALLSSYTATVFRTRKCVYDAVSDFLCVRFICETMADPSLVDPTFVVTKPHMDIVAPFAELLEVPFRLELLGNKWGELILLNTELIGKYETIYNFVMSASVADRAPVYAKPSGDATDSALRRLLENISIARESFVRKYTDLYEKDCDKTASSFAMAELIAKLFR
jgi:hypothetical protein